MSKKYIIIAVLSTLASWMFTQITWFNSHNIVSAIEGENFCTNKNENISLKWVISNNTFEVRCGEKLARVKIIWIDSRFSEKCLKLEEKEYLENFLQSGKIQLYKNPRSKNTDKKWRLLRYVSVDGQDYWESAINKWISRHYGKYHHKKSSLYRKKEKEAWEYEIWLWWEKCKKSKKK